MTPKAPTKINQPFMALRNCENNDDVVCGYASGAEKMPPTAKKKNANRWAKT
jgi:hypothetical protein